jgi:capsular polysaccharide biosynthesis protein
MQSICQRDFFKKNIKYAYEFSKVDIPISNFNNQHHNNLYDDLIFLLSLKNTKVYPDFFIEYNQDFVKELGYVERIEKNMKLSFSNPTMIDQEVFLCGGDSNYYHWLLNWIPRLFLYEMAKLQCNIVVNKNMTKWQKDTLSVIFPNTRFNFITIDKPTIFSTVYVPNFFLNPQHSPFAIRSIRQKVLFNNQHKLYDESYSNIYISRRKASKRHIVNEEELFTFLEQYGYRMIYLEDLSFFEQAKIFFSAKNIISPHGAGLANLIFIQPKCNILEIINNYYTKLFWSLGYMMGCEHYKMFKAQPVRIATSQFKHNDMDVYVDLEQFKLDNKIFYQTSK